MSILHPKLSWHQINQYYKVPSGKTLMLQSGPGDGEGRGEGLSKSFGSCHRSKILSSLLIGRWHSGVSGFSVPKLHYFLIAGGWDEGDRRRLIAPLSDQHRAAEKLKTTQHMQVLVSLLVDWSDCSVPNLANVRYISTSHLLISTHCLSQTASIGIITIWKTII